MLEKSMPVISWVAFYTHCRNCKNACLRVSYKACWSSSSPTTICCTLAQFCSYANKTLHVHYLKLSGQLMSVRP